MSQGNDLPVISAAQVAVLASKVDAVIESFAEVKGMIHGMAQHINGVHQTVVSLQEKVISLERDAKEAKDTAFHQGKAIHALRDDVTRHSTIWKLVGGSVTLMVGAAVWGFNNMNGVKEQQHQHDRRIIILEMRADRSPPNPKPPNLETPQ